MVIQTLQDVRSLASKMYPSASSSSFDNVVLTGGVALNSVTNGILKSGGGPFRRIYIPPFVGDEGVAFGAAVKCAMEGCKGDESKKRIVKGMLEDFEPYTGTVYGEEDIRDAIEGFEGSIRVERYEGREEKLLECVAGRIAKGEVVAWYQGSSEIGPRALGHRSILGDPRNGTLVEFINKRIKVRENFRPFAPSVMKEHVAEWFEWEGGVDENDTDVSPYMSLTLKAREDKMERIPAVIHVDGSSRIQSVDGGKKGTKLYHRLINKFFELTGVPMVLNTSFNTIKGEPIVEKPRGAMVSFLTRAPELSCLVLGDYLVERREVTVGLGDKFEVNGGFSLTTRERFWGGKGDMGTVEETTVRMQGLEEWGEIVIDPEVGGDVLTLMDGTRTVKEVADEIGLDVDDIVRVVGDMEKKMLLVAVIEK
mmetsp:Transcript_5613/g.11223  ORF Transcript_5613/g.11223 Transcript_5613/m.11223 type:complete len:423 (+) Transcript_5613:110-1378(+)